MVDNDVRLQQIADCMARGGSYEECAGISTTGDLTDPEMDMLDRWNTERPEGIGAVGASEAKRAKVYMDLYGVNFDDALWLFSMWQSGAPGNKIPQPSQALTPGPRPSLEEAIGGVDFGGWVSAGTTAAARPSFISRTGETATSQRGVEYFEYPSAEQILDDFETALATHISTLKGAGGDIPLSAVEGLLNNPDFIMNEYLADLGTRAARGENIFQVVGGGFGGEGVSPVGTRPGAEQTRESMTKEQATTSYEGGAEAPHTLSQEEKTTEDYKETEDVVARPGLYAAKTPSPLEWLQEKLPTAGEILTLYEGKKGMERAEYSRPLGTIVTPKRVG